MRRKDRGITNKDDIITIIKKCKVLHLAVNTDDGLYIVPVNFGFSIENEKFIFYIHSAKQGKKINAIKKYPNVCVEADCSHKLVTGRCACEYSYMYESFIAQGTGEIVDSHTEKAKALQTIMKHQTGKDFEFGKTQTDTVSIIKITVNSITAKAYV
ncbi:MAG: pyridoxamine 5'-phosphate oxidase family protein [Oscillospiraceae bacterium]|nr:pyridoxamine 5'-phosphate oxidase family protein [Oscillospiraceae bacterium]